MPENTHRFRFTQDCWKGKQPKALIFHEIHYVISSSLIPARKPLAHSVPTNNVGLSPNMDSSVITHPIMHSWVIGLPPHCSKAHHQHLSPWLGLKLFPFQFFCKSSRSQQSLWGISVAPLWRAVMATVDGWWRGHASASLPCDSLIPTTCWLPAFLLPLQKASQFSTK